jgi:hypothetical protein
VFRVEALGIPKTSMKQAASRYFGGTLPALCQFLAFTVQLLNMKVMSFSKMLVNLQWTTQPYPQDRMLLQSCFHCVAAQAYNISVGCIKAHKNLPVVCYFYEDEALSG